MAALHFVASEALWRRNRFTFSVSQHVYRAGAAAIGCAWQQQRRSRAPAKAVCARRVARALRSEQELARFVKCDWPVEPTWQETGRWHTGALTPGS
jgi:hypothetical protein